MKLAAHEEEALHMIRLAKITGLVSNQPEGEYAKEVIEFVANMKLNKDNCIDSRITISHISDNSKVVEFVRELYLTPTNLNVVYELNDQGEDPTEYMVGREQEYLNRIAET